MPRRRPFCWALVRRLGAFVDAPEQSPALGQGRENVRAFLKANPDMADAIEDKVRKSTSKIADELLGTPEPDEGQDLEG